MSLNDVINTATAIILSLGGSSAIVIVLSTWLGKVWANRILEEDKLKYSKELELTKAKYEKQLEEYKQELDKSKSLFIRYSESQFKLYNDLWATLCKLKSTANDLWNDANIENLRSFALHLDKTINSIEKHRLLIEDDHYEKLLSILSTFNKFKLGKKNLIGLRKMTEEQSKLFDMAEIVELINRNKESKDQYDKLLEKIAKDFKRQISLTN